MTLHVPTLFLMSLATFLVTTGIGFFYLKTRKTYPGFSHWIACIFSIAFSMLAMVLRPHTPLVISVIFANFFTVLSALLALDGCQRFLNDQPLSKKWYLLLLGANQLLAILFTLAADRLDIRIALLSIFCTIALGKAALILFSVEDGAQKSIARTLGGLFVFWCALALMRGTNWLLWPKETFTSQDFSNSIYFAVTSLIMVGIAYSFIMLNNAKVESELNDANEKLSSSLNELKKAIAEIRTLKGFIPVCSWCKSIRDTETNEWLRFESYIQSRTDAHFSHSVCPDCARKHYPEVINDMEKRR